MTNYAAYQGFAQDVAGNAVGSVNVEVRSETTGNLATIYSGRTGGALANPFVSDADGYFKFHAAGDAYKIRLYVGSSGAPTFERIYRYVAIGTAGEHDDSYFAASSTTRERLTAARTYYVRTDGSDSNTGLVNSSGGAFLTLQKAYDVAKAFDLGAYNITIQVAAGTYSGGVICEGVVPGAGTINFLGDTTTPTNVVIDGGAAGALSVRAGARVVAGGFSFISTSLNGIEAVDGGTLLINGKVDFGACPGSACSQMYASRDGKLRISASFTIHGNAAYMGQASHGGQIRLDVGTGQWSANSTYSGAVVLTDVGEFITTSGFTFDSNGKTITGIEYIEIEGGRVQCAGNSPPTNGFIPGTVVGSSIHGGAINQPTIWFQRGTATFVVGDAASGVVFQKGDNSATTFQVDNAGIAYVKGLLDLSAAAAGQIKFPATQNASADANTLDDYEEGTWTPVLTFATVGNLSVSYTIQQGWYEKWGRVCIAHFAIQTSAFTFTTASGNVQITGLPFTAASPVGSNAQRSGGVQWQGITKANYTDMCPAAENSSTMLTIRASGSGQTGANVTAADMPTGGSVIFRGACTFST